MCRISQLVIHTPEIEPIVQLPLYHEHADGIKDLSSGHYRIPDSMMEHVRCKSKNPG